MVGSRGSKSVATGAPSDRCLRSGNIRAAVAVAAAGGRLSPVHDQQHGVYILDLVSICEALWSGMNRSAPPNKIKLWICRRERSVWKGFLVSEGISSCGVYNPFGNRSF